MKPTFTCFPTTFPPPSGFGPICTPNGDSEPPTQLEHRRDEWPETATLSPLPTEFRFTDQELSHRKLNCLSPRQREVLEGLRQGMATNDLAIEMGVAEETIRSHVTAILQTLGVHSRLQAVAVANDLASSPSPSGTPSDDALR